jgi:hypothetical protein
VGEGSKKDGGEGGREGRAEARAIRRRKTMKIKTNVKAGYGGFQGLTMPI